MKKIQEIILNLTQILVKISPVYLFPLGEPVRRNVTNSGGYQKPAG